MCRYAIPAVRAPVPQPLQITVGGAMEAIDEEHQTAALVGLTLQLAPEMTGALQPEGGQAGRTCPCASRELVACVYTIMCLFCVCSLLFILFMCALCSLFSLCVLTFVRWCVPFLLLMWPQCVGVACI